MNNLKKYNFFVLGYFSKKDIILFIISPLTYFINDLIKYSDYLIKPWNNNFPYFFSQYFGYLFVNGIIFIYYKIKIFKNYIFFNIINNDNTHLKFNKNIDDCNNNLLIFEHDLNIKTKRSSIFFCLLIIIFDNFPLCFAKYPNFQDYYFKNLFPFEIISLMILSKFLLKLHIGKHHYFSIIIIIIGLFIINLINIEEISFQLNQIYVIYFALFSHYIYTLEDIFAYYLLYEKEMKIYIFSIYLGIIGIMIGFIISLINQFFDFQFLNINIFIDIYSMLKRGNVIQQIISFSIISLSQGINFICFWFIFKLFKPWFFGVFSPIYGLLNCLHQLITILNQSNGDIEMNIIKKKLFEIIIYLLLIFMSLIVNEQIICNFWGLNMDTKREITNRSIHEYSIISRKSLTSFLI